jgi:hypothetical protein
MDKSSRKRSIDLCSWATRGIERLMPHLQKANDFRWLGDWNSNLTNGVRRTHGDEVRALVGRVALIELVSVVLARALEPFPIPVHTLDALHLASTDFLLASRQRVELASYGERLRAGACAMDIPLCKL